MKEQSEQKLYETFLNFSCSRNKSVEKYLRETAVRHERARISRTYLILDTEPEEQLIGYITIAMKCLNVGGEQNNEELIKKMNVSGDIAQSYLIGQLGKVDGCDKKIGEFAMDFALDVIEDASELIGCRVVRLDCKDALVKYYEGKGFSFLNKNSSGNLNRMVMVLA
ncbi:MAG: hypothetical protein LBR42_02630 [Candidatus Methanoplasma sp.]|jgi:hypothetical protein|nr:hypothetical protein [Candidatus Methanoplasma sp.]